MSMLLYSVLVLHNVMCHKFICLRPELRTFASDIFPFDFHLLYLFIYLLPAINARKNYICIQKK